MIRTLAATYHFMNIFFINDKKNNLNDLISKNNLLPIDEFPTSDEQQVRFTTPQNMVRNKMYQLFSKGMPDFITENNFPVGKITFAISFMIATDGQYRKAFFANFQGKVPAITQFLFKSFRYGNLCEEVVLTKYSGDELPFGISLESPLFNTRSPETQIDEFMRWFKNLHLFESELQSDYFKTYVPAEAIPMWSDELLLFPGFDTTDGSIISSPVFESQNRSLKCIFWIIIYNLKLEFINPKPDQPSDPLSILFYLTTKKSFTRKLFTERMKSELEYGLVPSLFDFSEKNS